MPELAEAETLRRDVERDFAGLAIERVLVSGLRSVRRHADPSEFAARSEGRTLTGVGRRGKFLLLTLDSGDVVVAHMGMSGQLLRLGVDDDPVKHTHVILTFGGGVDLRFVDPRTFGQMFVTGPDLPELAALGLDPLAAPAQEVRAVIASRPTKLKPLLMDQRFIAGIGNMYADEILFAARLRPDRRGRDLSSAELVGLQEAITAVLSAAIEHRGSSLADEQYRDLYGRIGGYQKLHNVYGREGQPCSRCCDPIVRVKAYGRSSFLCLRCQKMMGQK